MTLLARLRGSIRVGRLASSPPRRNLFGIKTFAAAILGQLRCVERRGFQHYRKLVFRRPSFGILPIARHCDSLSSAETSAFSGGIMRRTNASFLSAE
ncbi:hypothetical protein HDG32_005365 [Paraburkholderia sp. CI2]|nr:hypothetical protein [Paraburkholderia sp. CI2]